MTHLRVLLAVLLGNACVPVHGPRGAYITFLPPDQRPPLVGASRAADSLWGAPEASERGDGIAEHRRASLDSLVRRFTPTLVLPRAEYVKVGTRKYRLLPVAATLIDTLRVDLINASPYSLRDTLNVALSETSTDSLVRLVEGALQYQSGAEVLGARYFDFPGRNPREWWQAYGRLRSGPDSARWSEPTVYAHPFVDRDGRVVIQYWWYYPFNDFLGNHEGDWEHINVVPSADGQRVEEVHYYFHVRSVRLPQGRFRPELEDGTHPMAYVGGRAYHVLDYPIRIVAGDRNEGSHGSFPYPGEWEAAAGAGTTESVRRRDRDTTRVLPWQRFRVVLTPEPSRIDYLRRPEIVREWAWLMLPVRWGFPSVPSLGSEIKFADVGNRAPYGPAYNAAWNRSAPGLFYPAYQVRKLSFVRSAVEDLLQPWYYLYVFRSPRFVHDMRGDFEREELARLGLAPRGGWKEKGLGSTLLGVHWGVPVAEAADQYGNSEGFLLWRNFWGKARVGAVELFGGYQRFPRQAPDTGTLFVYPITANLVLRGPDRLFRPYASVGGGVYGWEVRLRQDNGAQLVWSGWDPGWTAAAGLEYYLRTKVALDVGVRYHRTRGPGRTDAERDGPFEFFGLYAGHYLRF
ncbi:MAG: hypothetical protein HY561_13215 [Gemmatimonadetes bacterium]|nr:hypothetical protein [Gemmatimonadota bacterium]